MRQGRQPVSNSMQTRYSLAGAGRREAGRREAGRCGAGRLLATAFTKVFVTGLATAFAALLATEPCVAETIPVAPVAGGSGAAAAAGSATPSGVGSAGLPGGTGAGGSGAGASVGAGGAAGVLPAPVLEGRYWLAIVPVGLPSDWGVALQLNGKAVGSWPAGEQTIVEVTSSLKWGENAARVIFTRPDLGVGGSLPPGSAASPGASASVGASANPGSAANSAAGPASGASQSSGSTGASSMTMPPVLQSGDVQMVLAPGILGEDGESITLDIPIFRIQRAAHEIPGLPEELKFTLPAPWQKPGRNP